MKKIVPFIFSLILNLPFVSAQWEPAEWPVLKSYDSEHLYAIALPLGGIGTGVVSLGGRGELRDWEIMNKPAVGYNTIVRGNDAPFFSIWIKPQDENPVCKALMGPLYSQEYSQAEGRPVNHHGLPRFEKATFDAAYPFGQVHLSDSQLPVKVRIKGFNPLIPGNADDSGIPVAVLSYEIENIGGAPVEVSVCGSLRNFVGQDGSKYYVGWNGENFPYGVNNNINQFRKDDYAQGIFMYSDSISKQDAAWGTIALTTNAKEGVTYRTSSTRNTWSNAILDFWEDFSQDGLLTEKSRREDSDPMASLAVRQTIPPRSKKTVTFFLTWNFPNRLGWVSWESPDHDKTVMGNYYSNRYKDAWDVLDKTIPRLSYLERKTIDFVSAVTGSTVPEEIREAALFNLNVLRSQTTFRISSGHFMGWEGTFDSTGSCSGTCTHVWNYEQATPFLFGDLSRTMRDVEFNYATNKDGRMSFRAGLPLGEGNRVAAADGQMGCIMKFYRDWQLSGDNEFLRSNWQQVKKVLAYAWIEKGWDANQDGVMEGSQHNTMDVNYYGPNPQMGLWYLGALRAGEEMAGFMKDKDFEKKCRSLYEKGSDWMDRYLFNGEYYEHKVTDPETSEYLNLDQNPEKMPDYQLYKGCLVDQLVGQYMAHICDLGYLVKPEYVRITLSSIMKYNYLADFSNHFNNMRSYVLGKESGLLMASWPKGRPQVPFPYFNEAMTGFEYTAAVGMLYEGMEADGMKCIRAIRSRFDGARRNPFSEPECGQHYARSMASWAALLAISDFYYSGVKKAISFTSCPGTYFWSNGYAWGQCKVSATGAILTVFYGTLNLNSFELKGKGIRKTGNKVLREGESLSVNYLKD